MYELIQAAGSSWYIESPAKVGLVQRLFTHYDLTMNFQQHALVGSTVRSYLSYLKAKGRITARFEDELLLWETI